MNDHGETAAQAVSKEAVAQAAIDAAREWRVMAGVAVEQWRRAHEAAVNAAKDPGNDAMGREATMRKAMAKLTDGYVSELCDAAIQATSVALAERVLRPGVATDIAAARRNEAEALMWKRAVTEVAVVEAELELRAVLAEGPQADELREERERGDPF